STILSRPDRVTRSVRSVLAATGGKPDLIRNDQYIWNDGSSTGVLVSRSESSTDGLKSWQTTYPTPGLSLVGSNVTVFAGGGLRYATNIASDGSYSVTTLTNGRAISSIHRD